MGIWHKVQNKWPHSTLEHSIGIRARWWQIVWQKSVFLFLLLKQALFDGIEWRVHNVQSSADGRSLLSLHTVQENKAILLINEREISWIWSLSLHHAVNNTSQKSYISAKAFKVLKSLVYTQKFGVRKIFALKEINNFIYTFYI